MPVNRLPLGRGVVIEVCPAERRVRTVYPDGRAMAATREDTPANRAEALAQGYAGEGAVWRSLVEHEALHSLLARLAFGRESLVLRHECGAEPARYALRLHEEALTLSAQRWLNTGRADPVLWPHIAALRGAFR
jgi:hypothetical protein